MLEKKFYWGTIRKAIVAFGNMFNNIHIDRIDAQGDVQQTIRIPLAYSSKQSFLARIDQVPGPAENRTISVTVPRMGFEITGIGYDPARKLPMIQQNSLRKGSEGVMSTQFVPTPYNIGISLYVYVKNMDDGLQIIEQILPYFNPDFNLTLKAMPELNITNDLPITLDSVNMNDTYEGDFLTRQSIIWTLQFTLKVNFFGPIQKSGIIKKTDIHVRDKDTLNYYGNVKSSVDPITAMPEDNYTIVTTFEGFE